MVKRILAAVREGDRRAGQGATGVGIITPYDAQRVELARVLHSGAEVASVDSYQGQERDLIIVSMTRANRRCDVGFVADHRRLNVAFTRARRGLIVVGDYDTLWAGDNEHFLADFLTDCVRRGLVLDASFTPWQRRAPPLPAVERGRCLRHDHERRPGPPGDSLLPLRFDR